MTLILILGGVILLWALVITPLYYAKGKRFSSKLAIASWKNIAQLRKNIITILIPLIIILSMAYWQGRKSVYVEAPRVKGKLLELPERQGKGRKPTQDTIAITQFTTKRGETYNIIETRENKRLIIETEKIKDGAHISYKKEFGFSFHPKLVGTIHPGGAGIGAAVEFAEAWKLNADLIVSSDLGGVGGSYDLTKNFSVGPGIGKQWEAKGKGTILFLYGGFRF